MGGSRRSRGQRVLRLVLTLTAILPRRLLVILIAAGSVLLVPLVAVQFTDEVDWTLSDFVIGAALLLGAGLTVELVLRRVRTKRSRVVLVSAVVAVLLFVWVELAVGVFA